ncbi:MAG: hypothetical protein ABJP45_16185 [Cyclobacteriaceae bacterium]
MIDEKIKKGIQALFFGCLLAMLWLYVQGYENSIGWEVTTSAEVVKYPALEIEGQLLDFSVIGDKYVLTESYTGGPIVRNRTFDTVLMSIGWIGICLVITASSFLKRYSFMFALALFTLLLNRLNLGEIGLFGIQSRLVILIPFIAFLGPLFYFNEYRPTTKFLVRFATLVLTSAIIAVFGISQSALFLDHFVSHSLFSFSIAGLVFLFILAEENVFGILFLVTRGRGGKSNFQHFVFLSLFYLANLILYYLNKSGIVPNSFSFFDPFALLIISCIVAHWTLKFKADHYHTFASRDISSALFYGLGIVLFSVLSLAFFRGNDAVYEGFHYFILYFHIGFGFFFFLYLIINFIDAFLQGFEVFKIAYKEQHFPYVSARLGGVAVILGFYFLSTQEPYNLLKSGYYVSLGNLEETIGNPDLADQYYQQASFLGYNTHHSNYQLAWNYSDKGNEYLTKTHFEKAAGRFPSPFAYVNYANLDMEINPVKVQATLERAKEKFGDGEILNNYGILRMQNEEWEKALENFEAAKSSSSWNQAPLLNKWATLHQLESIDSVSLTSDYQSGNHGVKNNILVNTFDPSFAFAFDDFSNVPVLHRQAYLLSSVPLFEDDTLSSLATFEIENSIDGSFNDRLRKGLAVHYYQKGEINKAFRMMDYLQANSYQHQKGGYLNDVGKMAIDQNAYRLALDFFERSAEYDQLSAEVNQLEALAALGRQDEISDRLLSTVEKDPGLTELANQVLANLKTAEFPKAPIDQNISRLESMDDESLVALASKNAFAEQTVIEAVRILEMRGNLQSYTIILEATEINPYSADLLISYAVIALEQNLVSYAEAVFPRIRSLVDDATYNQFLAEFENLKKELSNEIWE